MSGRARRGGVRIDVLGRLTWSSVRAHTTRALLTCVVVGISVMAIVATSGRTDATRRAVLARLEEPSARLIRVVDRTGQAGLKPEAVGRVSKLSAVEWVVGLTVAGPLGRNEGAGGAREGYARPAVGTRGYWGSLVGPLVHLVSGRLPEIGEAVAGTEAQAELGLVDGAGTVVDETRGPTAVVGTISMDQAIENLAAYALIEETGSNDKVSELIILARSSAEVEQLVARIPKVLGHERPEAIGIDRPAELAALRKDLVQQVGALDSAVLIGSVASSALLVGAMSYGAIAERRREFGIRRSQGATRNVIALLVVAETILLAVVGSILGTVAGNVIVVRQVTVAPDFLLSAAVSILVSVAALAGSLPAAASAAYSEPLYVLRSS